MTDFVRALKEIIKAQSPMPVLHHKSKSRDCSYLPSDLASAHFVFVRVDAVRRPLLRPYEGPYRVVQAGPKVFTVLRNGKNWNVSIDRLKPAPDPLDLGLGSFTVPTPYPLPLPAADELAPVRRSSRSARPPERFQA